MNKADRAKLRRIIDCMDTPQEAINPADIKTRIRNETLLFERDDLIRSVLRAMLTARGGEWSEDDSDVRLEDLETWHRTYGGGR